MGQPNRRKIVTRFWATSALLAAVSGAAFAQRAAIHPTTRTLTTHPATRTVVSTHPTTRSVTPAAPLPPLVSTNPLLPPPLPLEAFYTDLTLAQKVSPVFPTSRTFIPLYSPQEYQALRTTFGPELDGITKLKVSAQLAFAQRLINYALEDSHATTTGLQRLLLMRAAAISYRSKDGYPVADAAVTAYITRMDKSIPTQVGALWSISNAMSRMAVTPKPERIRYDGIAAKANMQLCLLLLDADQVAAAQGLIKQIAYHEGWLKGDTATKALIAQVRARVTSTGKMMDFLATQYEPAIHNDASALMVVYLYGRFVKSNPGIVADLPPRVPNSALSTLADSLDRAARDASATFSAAENLRTVAATLPEGTVSLIKQRTLYAALENYRIFLESPSTERDRVHRTMARMALEGVIADGARKATGIDPFAVAAPTTAPSRTPASPRIVPEPAEPRAVGMSPDMSPGNPT